MPLLRNAFRIGRARTGLGAFAIRDLPARRRIAEYKGPMLDKAQSRRAENRGNRYLFEIDADHTIDGASRRNVARYFNHSCHPNAEVNYVGMRIFIKTARPIKKGDEIVYDYGMSYLKNVIGVSNCQCSRCRRRKARKAKERREKLARKAARKSKKTKAKRQGRR